MNFIVTLNQQKTHRKQKRCVSLPMLCLFWLLQLAIDKGKDRASCKDT
jgi:hypothetical protein